MRFGMCIDMRTDKNGRACNHVRLSAAGTLTGGPQRASAAVQTGEAGGVAAEFWKEVHDGSWRTVASMTAGESAGPLVANIWGHGDGETRRDSY